jgi:hypothetical protein
MVQSEFTHVGGPRIFSPFFWSYATNLHRCLARYSWAHHGPQLRYDLVPESCSKVANMYWDSSVGGQSACLPATKSVSRSILCREPRGTLCRDTAVRIKGETRYWFLLFCDLLWLFIFEEWCKCTSVPDPDPYVFRPPGSVSGKVMSEVRIRGSGFVPKCHSQHWV